MIGAFAAIVLCGCSPGAHPIPPLTIGFDAAPRGVTSETTATIAFHASGSAQFTCALDEASPHACASPQQLDGLHDGAHTFRVTARGDLGGTAEGSVEWKVATATPAVHIHSGPAALTNAKDAEVRFATQGVAPLSVTCAVDGTSAAPCASPVTYAGLPDGEHRLSIIVADAQGRRSAAEHVWTVDTVPPPAPTLVVTGRDRGVAVVVEGPSGATYFVEHDTDGTFAAPAAVLCSPGAPCAIAPLENCRTHHLRAVAKDPAGNVAVSGGTVATPMPTSLHVTVNGGWGVIEAAWSEPDDAVLTPYAATYRIDYGDREAVYGGTRAAEGPSPLFVSEPYSRLRGLPPDDPVHVRVVKTDGTCEGRGTDALATPYPWKWVAPQPTGNDLLALTCTASGRCMALGVLGTVLTTDDGGRWIRRNGGTPHDLVSLSMTSPAQGYALASPFFPWAPHRTWVLVTEDGGETWLDAPASPDTTAPLRALAFQGDIGLVAGELNAMFRSADGARSWQPIDVPGGGTWNALTFRDTGKVVAVGEAGLIATSDDGGVSWQERGSGTPYTLLAVSCPTALGCWAVGEAATVLTTTDGGATWTSRMTTCLTAALRSVSFATAAAAWAVGDDGSICATHDGGTTWTRQLGPEYGYRLQAVHASSDTDAWIAGMDGVLFRTIDGGATWTSERRGPAYWIDALWAPDPRSILAIAQGGVVIRSLDAGASWTESRPVMSSLCALAPIDAASALAVGDGGVVLKTTDFGTTWTRLPDAGAGVLLDAHCLDADRCWVAGADGLRVTGNGGETWSVVPVGQTREMSAVRFATATVGYAAEYRWPDQDAALLWRTEDAGATWVALRTATRVHRMAAPDARTVYAGESGGVLVSTDGGLRWTTLANVAVVGDVNGITVSGEDVLVVADGQRWRIVAVAPLGSDVARESRVATDKPLKTIAALSVDRWLAAGGGAMLETSTRGR